MEQQKKGCLILIGGREEKGKGSDRTILKEVSKRAKPDGLLLIVTVASELGEETGKEYVSVFQDLGVPQAEVLALRTRADGYRQAVVDKVSEADVVFFSGGDQLRLVSKIGGTPFSQRMRQRFAEGMTVAGTSAGAAAMADIMLISGPGEKSLETSALGMAPGLALVRDIIIDSHFAERARFGRLLAGVAENPEMLGLGIDENIAVIVEDDRFRVLGASAVYVFDGTSMSHSSLSEAKPVGVLTLFDVKLHVLGEGDGYDLGKRHPLGRADLTAEA